MQNFNSSSNPNPIPLFVWNSHLQETAQGIQKELQERAQGRGKEAGEKDYIIFDSKYKMYALSKDKEQRIPVKKIIQISGKFLNAVNQNLDQKSLAETKKNISDIETMIGNTGVILDAHNRKREIYVEKGTSRAKWLSFTIIGSLIGLPYLAFLKLKEHKYKKENKELLNSLDTMKNTLEQMKITEKEMEKFDEVRVKVKSRDGKFITPQTAAEYVNYKHEKLPEAIAKAKNEVDKIKEGILGEFEAVLEELPSKKDGDRDDEIRIIKQFKKDYSRGDFQFVRMDKENEKPIQDNPEDLNFPKDPKEAAARIKDIVNSKDPENADFWIPVLQTAVTQKSLNFCGGNLKIQMNEEIMESGTSFYWPDPESDKFEDGECKFCLSNQMNMTKLTVERDQDGKIFKVIVRQESDVGVQFLKGSKADSKEVSEVDSEEVSEKVPKVRMAIPEIAHCSLQYEIKMVRDPTTGKHKPVIENLKYEAKPVDPFK